MLIELDDFKVLLTTFFFSVRDRLLFFTIIVNKLFSLDDEGIVGFVVKLFVESSKFEFVDEIDVDNSILQRTLLYSLSRSSRSINKFFISFVRLCSFDNDLHLK